MFDFARWQASFARDLSHVVVHDNEQSAALSTANNAYGVATDGEVFLGRTPAGDLGREVVIAHELAHALGARTEEGAERAAAGARARLHGRAGPAPTVPGSPGRSLALHSCSRGPSKAQRALDGEIAFTADLARDALSEYRALSDADRHSAVVKYYPGGAIQRLLGALPADDASGPFNDVVQDILRRVQRHSALASAQASGLATESHMVVAQSMHMEAENLALAQAATGSATPTQAQVTAQQAAQVAQTSIPPSSSVLTPIQVLNHTTAAVAAVVSVVSYAKVHHPELDLTAADFKVDVVGLENRGAGVIAYGEVEAGRNVAVVGRTFTRFVQANPAYALSVVVHELHGHPEYGPYGLPGSEYGLELYDRAARLMPGYVQPTGAARTSEIDAYGYQETEIYSLLRSLPYHTPLAAKDAALQAGYVDPEPTVVGRLQLIQSQWEARVAKALVRGMYERFRLDPRLTPAALAAFRRSVTTVFGADAKDILK
ncbi:eCIS core domain-containing protein [Kribbella sp. NPDC002412]